MLTLLPVLAACRATTGMASDATQVRAADGAVVRDGVREIVLFEAPVAFGKPDNWDGAGVNWDQYCLGHQRLYISSGSLVINCAARPDDVIALASFVERAAAAHATATASLHPAGACGRPSC